MAHIAPNNKNKQNYFRFCRVLSKRPHVFYLAGGEDKQTVLSSNNQLPNDATCFLIISQGFETTIRYHLILNLLIIHVDVFFSYDPMS